MATKSQLLRTAKSLGIDADSGWTKQELEDEIVRVDEERRAEKKKQDTPVDETASPPDSDVDIPTEVSVDVGFMRATIDAGDDGEFGTSDDVVNIRPIKTETEELIDHIPMAGDELPVNVDKTDDPNPALEVELSNRYKCLCGMTLNGKVKNIGDIVTLTPEQAAVHLASEAIGPVDAVQAKLALKKALPGGTYKLVYGLTLNDAVYIVGDEVDLTSEQAELYHSIGAIEPR